MRNVRIVAVVLLCAGIDPAVLAQTGTVLKRRGREAELVDSARYSRARKAFTIAKGPATYVVEEAEVEFCRPPKPTGLDTTTSTAELAEIVKTHRRLWWDVKAFERLMPMYVRDGRNEEAIRLFRDMHPQVAADMPLALHRCYWDALKQEGRLRELERELRSTVQSGSREAAAWAYVMQGDLLSRRGNHREALVDGYLKVVVLFQDVKSCRRDALRRSIATFETLGDSRADTLRRQLIAEFPGEGAT